MHETILFPSPNWFQVSVLVVTRDGWLIYGGPSKSICVLEPLSDDQDGKGDKKFRTHVLSWAHPEKIVSIDVTPNWPVKRQFLAGSSNGTVKLWSLEYEDKDFLIKSLLSHDIHQQEKEEIAGVGYSTEIYGITVGGYGNVIKWDLNSNVVKTYKNFLKNFKPVCISCSPHVPLNVAVGTKQGIVFVLDLNGSGKIIYKIRGHDDEIVNISWCPQFNVIINKSLSEESVKDRNISDRMDKIRLSLEEVDKVENEENIPDQSGEVKKLPEDSFDGPSVVEEDDIFDIYQDHEADEFGHTKFVPKNVVVKVENEKTEEVNYLAECLKLKEDILNRKNQPEPSIESLVEALDKTHVNGTHDSQEQVVAGTSKKPSEESTHKEASEHIHKHLLASISKHGGVRIWSKAGKLVASCAVPTAYNKHQKNKFPIFATLLWYKPNVLLIGDGKNQLLESNPLIIDAQNKLTWKLIHNLHKRGIHCIASDAPRVQSQEIKSTDYSVWTTSQDRNIIRYSYEQKKKISTLPTCGGYIYMVQPCPYDARKIATCVGDGAVRVSEFDIDPSDECKLIPGNTTMYWQNVQGKVLTVAWHPTRENLLAFGTAESRVGLIDTSGKTERAARVLRPCLRGGVYSLRWGEGEGAGERHRLYAIGGGEAVVYNTQHSDEAPEQITVSVDDQPRQISAVASRADLMVFGTHCGGVVVMKQKEVQAAVFAYSKMIHTIEWHPQLTSNSNQDSQYKDLMAVCSNDKQYIITLLQYKENEDSKTLSQWKVLSGHKSTVYQLAWNPHIEGVLLSTSKDCTVRVWEVCTGACVSVFARHGGGAVAGAWPAAPGTRAALSGGADCTLRLWRTDRHPAHLYDESKHEQLKKEKKNTKEKKAENEVRNATEAVTSVEKHDSNEQLASIENKVKASKKFLLPILSKQINMKKIAAIRKILKKYMESKSINYDVDDSETSDEFDIDFVKIFGNINEVNELLDMELMRHKESGRTEAFVMLCVVRGRIDAAVAMATDQNAIDTFLLSVAPCVSFKYWKDVTQLYLEQLDRSIAKKEDQNNIETRFYGGPIFRKMAAQLSVHDIKGAVDTLIEANLYKEAYLLCKTRYMDSIAEETLTNWASNSLQTGDNYMAAMCYIALRNLPQAATALGRSKDQICLGLAAEIAKLAGQNTFAQHLDEKQALMKNNQEIENVETELNKLPSRIDLVMKVNGENNVNGQERVNGLHGDPNVVGQSVVKENGDVETSM